MNISLFLILPFFLVFWQEICDFCLIIISNDSCEIQYLFLQISIIFLIKTFICSLIYHWFIHQWPTIIWHTQLWTMLYLSQTGLWQHGWKILLLLQNPTPTSTHNTQPSTMHWLPLMFYITVLQGYVIFIRIFVLLPINMEPVNGKNTKASDPYKWFRWAYSLQEKVEQIKKICDNGSFTASLVPVHLPFILFYKVHRDDSFISVIF